MTREISNRVILDLNHEGDLWNMMPNNSSVLNLIVLQGLAMQTAQKLEVPLAWFRRNHPGGQIGARLRHEA